MGCGVISARDGISLSLLTVCSVDGGRREDDGVGGGGWGNTKPSVCLSVWLSVCLSVCL